MEDLPLHLVLEILTSGRLSAVDLVCLELTSMTFRGNHGLVPKNIRSLVDFAAFRLCGMHPVYTSFRLNSQQDVLNRCNGNWKQLLRFLQSVEESSAMVETSAGNMQIKSGRYHTLLIKNSVVYSCGSNLCGVLGHGPETTQLVSFSRLCFPAPVQVIHMSASHNHAAFVTLSGQLLRFLQSVEESSAMVETSAGNMQIKSGRYHTLLIKNSVVYSCGSNLCGVLGHGPETTQLVSFSRLCFPAPVQVIHMSASHNHAAFVTLSGQVYTCGDNSFFCCGHQDTSRPLFRPRLLETLREIPIKKVAVGLSFTAFLSRQGQVYTCGSNSHGQLGHGDTLDRPTPKCVESFDCVGSIVEIAAGPSYVLAVCSDGTLFSFGAGNNFCLGHGEQQDELQPRAVQSFERNGIHVVRVSAGDEHVVALDSCGNVYTWGKGYCGALGHGDESDRTTSQFLKIIRGRLAIQVCASKRKTFVLMENGSVYGFGWMGFGSLGFPDRGISDKILKPRVLECLKGHHISQVSTGLYHTVIVTNKGRIFGFGDNERAQLGHDNTLRGCLHPTEIHIQEDDGSNLLPGSSGDS